MNRFLTLVLIFLSCAAQGFSQQRTLGIRIADSLAYPSYTLVPPMTGTKTYLIDMCGRVVHQWTSQYEPGHTVRLTESGNLMRMVDNRRSILGGAGGGGFEIRSWDDKVLWYFSYASDSLCIHHAFDTLPNGNILAVAYERFSRETALEAGRDSAYTSDQIWVDHIIEIKPTFPEGGEIVWQWHAWDHIVQDRDPNKPNYGDPKTFIRRINVNYPRVVSGQPPKDWLHFNSVAYNAELDQIVVSVNTFNEIWVIDHSTTTEEARTSSGGRYGHGGDILYRWGNPEAYGRGTTADKTLYSQHDPHWIPRGYKDEGKIMVFNNGRMRPGGNASSVDVIETPVEPDGSYRLNADSTFGPDTASWSYREETLGAFFSLIISGASRLPNGNTLICEGTRGRIFEVDDAGVKHWEYVSPMNGDSAKAQGSAPAGSLVFRSYKYGYDFPAFAGKNLKPGSVLERNPLPFDCIFDTEVHVAEEHQSHDAQAFPNPFSDYIMLNSGSVPSNVEIVDMLGNRVFAADALSTETTVRTDMLAPGVYLLRTSGRTLQMLVKNQ